MEGHQRHKCQAGCAPSKNNVKNYEQGVWLSPRSVPPEPAQGRCARALQHSSNDGRCC